MGMIVCVSLFYTSEWYVVLPWIPVLVNQKREGRREGGKKGHHMNLSFSYYWNDWCYAMSCDMTEIPASRMMFSANTELYNEIIDGKRLPLSLRSRTLCGAHSIQRMIFWPCLVQIHIDTRLFFYCCICSQLTQKLPIIFAWNIMLVFQAESNISRHFPTQSSLGIYFLYWLLRSFFL